MNKDEKNLLEELSNSVDSKMNYNDISNEINFSKYEKKKSFSFLFQKRLVLTFSSFILVLVLIITVVLFPNKNNNEDKPGDTPNYGENDDNGNSDEDEFLGDSNNSDEGLNKNINIYNGFVKDDFEGSIGKGPIYESSGPSAPPPVIDGYFNVYDNNIFDEEENGDLTQNPSSKPNDFFDISYFKYIYEVEYKNTSNLEYICVYIEKELAEKIYEECNDVCDAKVASPLNNVNGSIVDWFYSNSYYDENKVIWCSFNDKDKIYKEVNGYLCVGVYQIQERIISREIFSNTIVNITDYIYSSLSFIENGGEYLIPVRYELTNYITWHASKIIIDETNKERLFMYSSEFECSIDIEANTIRLKTLAVQNEEELDKISSTLLKDYHILSNKIIVENEYPDKEFGDKTYITYKYTELVQILQDLAKVK